MLHALLAHLRSAHGRRPARNRPTHGAPKTRRPWLETLEHRCVPAGAAFGPLPADLPDPAAYDPTHILVRLSPDAGDPRQLNVVDGAVFKNSFALLPGLWEVELPGGVSVEAALAAYRASAGVVSAIPNYRLQIHQVPSDPQFGSLWGLHNTGQSGGTADADIDAAEAWNLTTGGGNIIVAVIDTGVDYNHPDLAANIWVNAGEIPGDGIDNDDNGFIDDVHGYDFFNNDGNPMDDHNHGTHVAGTIGAVGNNGIGVAGVAWNVQIMALKCFDASGNGTVADALRAFNYAVEMGAHISNNSYGTTAPEATDPLFEEAIQNAASAGHIFVAAAGNSSSDNDAVAHFPSGFNADNIISVAATDRNDRLASFSNYGATTVDLAAPGVDILSTVIGGGYQLFSGTSMATPHVAGAVALVRSFHPEWTYRQVIDEILGSVDYLPGLEGRVATAGRLNVARALLDIDGPRVVRSDPSGGVGGIVSSLRVSFNESIDPASFDAGDIASFTGPQGPIAVTGVSVVPNSMNRKFTVAFAPQIAHGTYEMILGPNITDRAGNPMDQDGDGILGEPLDDRFTASFLIGDQYVFHADDAPVSLVPFSTTTSFLTVSDDLSIADLDVRINISTLDVGYINVALVSPGGTSVTLAPMTAVESGPEYRDTVFDDEALIPIGSGTSPYAGSYQPANPLSAFDNRSAQGTWRLQVLNLFGGAINSWSLLLVANPPRLTIDDVVIVEGDDGVNLATFTVRLSNPIAQSVTVDFSTSDGSASAGSDYDFASGTLTFAPGEVVKTITVPVRGDTLDEPDETFSVTLANPVNATISDGEGVATILNDELAVSIADLSVIEGNSGSVTVMFAVSLSQPSEHGVTVQYATAPGTAAVTADYTTTSGSVTFAPGETLKLIPVVVKGDTRFERDETFFVNITATGAFVIDSQAVGTIVNDDPVPVMSVADVSIVEGHAGTKNLSFTVKLSVASGDPVTVDYATADGTASAGSDYTAAAGTVTFAAGQTSRTVAVAIAGDTAVEPSETLLLNLTNAVGAILMDDQAVGTILTDDLVVTIGDVAVAEGDAGAAEAVFTVSLSEAVSFAVEVNYATGNGTGAAAADYVAASGKLVFAPGETVKQVPVIVIPDVRNEVDETFVVNLTSPVNALLGAAQGRATILDDDPLPGVSIGDAVIVEGDSGTKNLTFSLSLSAPSGQVLSVQYSTADGTAGAGDYVPKSGVVSFSAGVTLRNITVALTGDTTPEPNETFFVNLSAPLNATIADAQAVGTIQDDDSLVVDNVVIVEGDSGTSVALFAVRLLAAQEEIVTVNYASANGTAVAGYDYLPVAGTLTFQPGETLHTVPVIILGDGLHESDETLFLNLSGAAGVSIADSQAVATITNDDVIPTVSVSDAFVAEGHSGTRNAVFTLTLSHASGHTVSVQYASADGSAVAGVDYQPRSGTASIGAGGTSVSVSVPVIGDVEIEGNEAFYLNLIGATNLLLANNQGIATIYDDDPLPVLSIGNVAVTEGNSGSKTFSFPVTLSPASTQTVTVEVTSADGTASAGSDYVAKTQVLTFSPGQTSKTATISVTGDTVPEPSETFFMVLGSPTNAVLGNAVGVGTILNDDTTLRVDDISVVEGDEGTTTGLFTVSLTGPLSSDPVSVNYKLANGTAGSGGDYVMTSGSLVFAPGETTKTVEVLVLGDTRSENDEKFYLNLSAAVNAAIADSQGAATILDAGEALPTVTVADVSIAEGASGTKNLTFTVRLSGPSGKTVSVNYASADGTATAGSDYTAKSGTINFSPGAIAVNVSVVVAGDVAAEADETFYLNLLSATGAVIDDNQAVGTINDDDSLIVEDVSVVEGDTGASVARFTVRLLVPRPHVVTVDYATANSTATAGADYLPVAGTLTFAPGETTQTVDVVIVGDRLHEGDHAFFLNLSNVSGTIVAVSRGTATILDDDQPPTLSITDVVTVAEGNSGTKSVTFTVRLSEPSGQAVSVQYATADGTATAGTDYVAKSGTLTFAAGQTTATITITVNGDADLEGDEFFSLILSNPLNATLSATEATALIIDDETLV
jgi:subtilisin family serine protease/subtilisin-like proprotein convertase family protein/DNA-binding cell septation regulator SpoVG